MEVVNGFGGWDFEQRLARRSVSRIADRCGWNKADCQDIEQDLLLKLLKSRHHFDVQRGTWESFVATVIRRQLATICQYRTAEKRAPSRCRSLTEPDGTEKHVACSCEENGLVDRSLDLHAAIEGLPDHEQRICSQLKWRSISQVARDEGMPRSTLQSQISKIRRRLEDQKLEDYLK